MEAATNSAMQCAPLYAYIPSNILASIGLALYTILIGVHAFHMVRTRTWDNSFMVLGGICMVAGFCARLYSTFDICNKAAYGIEAVLLLLGPTFIMFTVVLTQTRFIAALGPAASRCVWVPIRWQRPAYLGMNVVLVTLQFLGAVLTVVGLPANITLLMSAGKLTVAIFVVQMFFWIFILAENIYFSIRFRGVQKRYPFYSNTLGGHWARWNQLFGLAIAIIALGRNLVRLTASGGVEFLITHEWTYYAFDGYQMFVVMGAWAAFYLPGWVKRLESHAHGSFAGQEQESERSDIADTAKLTTQSAGYAA